MAINLKEGNKSWYSPFLHVTQKYRWHRHSIIVIKFPVHDAHCSYVSHCLPEARMFLRKKFGNRSNNVCFSKVWKLNWRMGGLFFPFIHSTYYFKWNDFLGYWVKKNQALEGGKAWHVGHFPWSIHHCSCFKKDSGFMESWSNIALWT